MLLDHVFVLSCKVGVVVFRHCRLQLVDTRHLSLDDDAKGIASVIDLFWMWIVR